MDNTNALKEKRKTQEELDAERRYSHSLITYAQEEEFIQLLPLAKHYAYIYHDKDIKEDGTPKEPHWHILLIFEQVKSLNWIRKHIPSEQNTFSKEIKDIGSAYEYLWHKNDKSKAQYNSNNVVCDNIEYWAKYTHEDIGGEDKNDMFINDLFAEDYNPVQMARKYGRDFIRYFNKYHEFRELFKGDFNR